MLVIVSDLHLKDGTSGSSITPDAFRVFAERLRSMAYRASWRADGRYRPIDSFHLLLMGDVLDLIRTERWLIKADGSEETLRPWDDPTSEAYTTKIAEITDAVLQHNRQGLSLLRKISAGELIRLPMARHDGQPDPQGERKPVKVHIYYMTGNHDWFFHLPGEAYNAIRARVIEAMGLSNPLEPFPYELEEAPWLAELLARHHVYARHGDIFDALNYHASLGRDHATVGDAMTIELLTRFPLEVRRRMGDDIPPDFSEGLKELSNVRPALVTPMWVNNLIRNHGGSRSQSEAIKAIWNETADRFIQTDFIRSQDQPFHLDTVDALEGALLFSKGFSFDALETLAGWVHKKLSNSTKISFAEHALKETAFKRKQADYIVYGHTHFHEIVPLDSYIRNGEVVSQIYINTGTWHPYYEVTLQEPENMKFVGLHVMAYATFFHEGERGGRRAEAWFGSLA